MIDTISVSHAAESVRLSFQLIRNTTSPDEKKSGVQSYVANIPADEVRKLNTKDNLRSYIAEYNPRKRNRVHDAIANTIQTAPERFITRNGGLAITASEISVDDGKKEIEIKNASVINGAQTQGEIKRYFAEAEQGEDGAAPSPFFVRVEIIVDSDPDQIVETAIARNTATPVKSISQAGARGHLDDLQASISSVTPNIRIKKKETDENAEDTRRILQCARLLMPQDVSENSSPAEKLRAYKNPEQCLTDFSEWYDDRSKASSEENRERARRKYEFTVQIAPHALQEYRYWESHDAWNGQRLHESTKKGGRACKRDKNGKIVWVSPGLVFPVLSAIGEFVVEYEPDKWKISKPGRFKPEELIKRAVSQFRAHDSDPYVMGREESVYDALRIYPATLMDVLRDLDDNADRA